MTTTSRSNRLKRRIEALGFGVRVISPLVTREWALHLWCPCGRYKWVRVPFDRPLAALISHLQADGLYDRQPL